VGHSDNYRVIANSLYHFHTYAVQAAVLCGSTTAENRRKPQIYGEDREETVLTAIKMYTLGDLPQDNRRLSPTDK